jgi:hypothetical protein
MVETKTAVGFFSYENLFGYIFFDEGFADVVDFFFHFFDESLVHFSLELIDGEVDFESVFSLEVVFWQTPMILFFLFEMGKGTEHSIIFFEVGRVDVAEGLVLF